jgi:hypothetical protein
MQKNRLGLWLSFIFFTFSGILQYGCQSSDHGNLDTASGNAAEIYVFYPENWEDSIQDIFTTTVFLADSSLVRFEENRKKEDPQYFESLFTFALHNMKQLDQEDPQTLEPLHANPLVWLIDPKSTLDGDFHREGINSLKDTVIDNVSCQWVNNVWAKPQVVLWIHDTHSAGENLDGPWIKKNQAFLCAESHRLELRSVTKESSRRHGALEQNRYSDSITRLLAGKYNVDLFLNADLKLVQATNDFVWLRNENSQFHNNLMVNIYPLSSSENMVMDSAVLNRNRFTQKYLKTIEGTWVEVSSSGIFPKSFYSVIENRNKVYYLRGWYTELNTDRRGPFIRKIIIDKANQRCIAIDGFLFAPNQPRNTLMRALEIMVHQSNVKS